MFLAAIFVLTIVNPANTIMKFKDPDKLLKDLKLECPQMSPLVYSPACPMGNIASDNRTSADGVLVCSQTDTTVGMTPYRLAHVNDRTETISIVGQLKFTWDIPCSGFKNVHSTDQPIILNYQSEEFWRPKFKLTNSIDDFEFTEISQIVLLSNNQTIHPRTKYVDGQHLHSFKSRFEYFVRGTLTATCNLQLSTFPFDEQVTPRLPRLLLLHP